MQFPRLARLRGMVFHPPRAETLRCAGGRTRADPSCTEGRSRGHRWRWRVARCNDVLSRCGLNREVYVTSEVRPSPQGPPARAGRIMPKATWSQTRRVVKSACSGTRGERESRPWHQLPGEAMRGGRGSGPASIPRGCRPTATPAQAVMPLRPRWTARGAQRTRAKPWANTRSGGIFGTRSRQPGRPLPSVCASTAARKSVRCVRTTP